MSSGPPASGTPPATLDLQHVAERCLQTLARRPSALITDIDGTLSHIVPHPAHATVDPAIGRSLQALAGVLDVVAVITAREEAVARRMVGAQDITYVGNYGLRAGQAVDTASVTRALDALRPRLAELPGLEVEEKGVAFSIHFRNTADPDSARLALLDMVTPVVTALGARVVEGKKVIEVVPGDLPDKRSAFGGLVERAELAAAVFMGDDLSDAAVFRDIRARRARGGFDGLAVAVVDAEADPAVIESADVTVPGVDAVAALLRELARRLTGGSAGRG